MNRYVFLELGEVVVKYRIQVDTVSQHQVGGVSYFTGVAPLEQFISLTLDANLRRPDKRTRTYREIQQSLQEAPEKFIGRNQGVRLTAESVNLATDRLGNVKFITLEAINGIHGIQNGGHTVTAMAELIEKGFPFQESPRVIFGITVGEKDEENNLACRTLNTASKVDARSIANKAGIFENLKPFFLDLGLTKVAYLSGQEGVPRDNRCNVNHLISLVHVLNNDSWDYTEGKHPFNAIKGRTGYPLDIVEAIPDQFSDIFINAFIMEKEIYEMLKEFAYRGGGSGFGKIPGLQKPKGIEHYVKLPDDTSFPIRIPANFAFPVIAGLRPYTKNGKWELPPEHKQELLAKMWKRYIQFLKQQLSQGNLSQAIGRGEIWQDLCLIASEFKGEKAELLAKKAA